MYVVTIFVHVFDPVGQFRGVLCCPTVVESAATISNNFVYTGTQLILVFAAD